MKAPVQVVSVGNIVVDFPVGPLAGLPGWGTLVEVPGRIEPAVGGNGAIFAMAARRLGLKCSLLGKVGHDLLGDWVLERLKDEGVDTTLVRRGAKGTSATVALLREGGERGFLHHIGANASLRAEDLAHVPRCRWLHLSSMFILPNLHPPAIAKALAAARRLGASTSLDVAWDPKGRWKLGECLGQADYFLPNADEAMAITGEEDPERAARALVRMGARNVVVKLGSQGSLVLEEGQRPFHAPCFKVEAQNSTGAGDTFDAALVYALLHGAELNRAALLANAAGALRVSSGSPSAQELLDFIRVRRRQGPAKAHKSR